MARYRLTRSARRDIDSILRTSEERHGREARIRYAALLLAAMRRVAEDPPGRSTLDRGELRPGIRSFTPSRYLHELLIAQLSALQLNAISLPTCGSRDASRAESRAESEDF